MHTCKHGCSTRCHGSMHTHYASMAVAPGATAACIHASTAHGVTAPMPRLRAYTYSKRVNSMCKWLTALRRAHRSRDAWATPHPGTPAYHKNHTHTISQTVRAPTKTSCARSGGATAHHGGPHSRTAPHRRGTSPPAGTYPTMPNKNGTRANREATAATAAAARLTPAQERADALQPRNNTETSIHPVSPMMFVAMNAWRGTVSWRARCGAGRMNVQCVRAPHHSRSS